MPFPLVLFLVGAAGAFLLLSVVPTPEGCGCARRKAWLAGHGDATA